MRARTVQRMWHGAPQKKQAKRTPFSCSTRQPGFGNTRRSTAGAVGGCMLVRAETLERAGGLEAIRGAVIDDCALAGLLKQHGGRLWIGLTDQSQSLRRYETFSHIAHSSIAADRSPKPPPSQVDVGSRNDHQKKPEQRTVARTMNHGKSLKWWAHQDSNLGPTDYESAALTD